MCSVRTLDSTRDEGLAHKHFGAYRDVGEFFNVPAEVVRRYFNDVIKPLYMHECGYDDPDRHARCSYCWDRDVRAADDDGAWPPRGPPPPSTDWSEVVPTAVNMLLLVLLSGMTALTYVEQLEGTAVGRRTRTLEAVRASRAKSIFIANISHEFRTPLQVVTAAASFLATSALSRDDQELVGAIVASGDALKSLVSNIIDLSRIEAEQLEWNHIVFDLFALVRATVAEHPRNAWRGGQAAQGEGGMGRRSRGEGQVHGWPGQAGRGG